jgi:threonine dehydratase
LLRPAGLLPSFSRAFDTSLGRSDLSSRLEAATGRSGAYPDGTLTRENNASSFGTHDEAMDTIADGIGVRIPIPEVLRDLEGMVDETLLVEERSIITGMQMIHRHAGLVVEPSGAVGVAALLENPNRFLGRRVATILCGGNLTPEQMRDWLP